MADLTLESDDVISSLLNTLLHNSSQPSTSSTPVHLISHQEFIPAVQTQPSETNFPFTGSENVCPGSSGLSIDGIGDVDCDSETQEDALMNHGMIRSSLKRSRAAEVHNLSEKRRRQRINEKMKALQKLIPNSNKTDKASMLDEAIEYLKQLQLQFQMLTLRNGSSVHPFYLPNVAQTMQPPHLAPLLDECNSSRAVGSFPANQEASILDFSSKPALLDYKTFMTPENSISGPSFVMEPSTNADYRSFHASMPSKVPCKHPSLPQLQLEIGHCAQSSSSGVSS